MILDIITQLVLYILQTKSSFPTDTTPLYIWHPLTLLIIQPTSNVPGCAARVQHASLAWERVGA